MAKKKAKKFTWMPSVVIPPADVEALISSAVKLFMDPQIPAGEVMFVGGSPHENWIEETRLRTEAICRN